MAKAAEANGNSFDVAMNFEKSTPGTHVYKEVEGEAGARMPSVYIRKTAFKGEPPKSLTVTVKF